MVHSFCECNLLDSLRQNEGFHGDQGVSLTLNTAVDIVNNTLFATPVIEKQSLRVIFLSVAEQFNEEQFLLCETSLRVPALESSSEEILSHHGRKVMLWTHMINLLLMNDWASDAINEHNSVGAQIFNALSCDREHIRIQVFVKENTFNAELSRQDRGRLRCKGLSWVLSAYIDDLLVSTKVEWPNFLAN